MPDSAEHARVQDRGEVHLDIGEYRIAAATAYGPRIVSLRQRGRSEMFVRLTPDVMIEDPDSGVYRFRGGHRLWVAPEVPATTYASDDHPCEVSTSTDQLTVTGPVDRAGFIKEVRVTIDHGRLTVSHRLTNARKEPVAAAPWAITQFPLGGVALLPVAGTTTSGGFQADRSLVLWPYTNLSDPRLAWKERIAAINAVAGPRLKLGSGPNPERLGYLIDQHLFMKEIPAAGAGNYPDRGAVAQVFVEAAFCELESVGPITTITPGSSITHREVWSVTECADLATAAVRVLGEARA